MDIDKHSTTEDKMPTNSNPQNIEYVQAPKPKYWAAFFIGLGVSILVAIILAILAIWLESEYSIVVILGICLVGVAIRHFIPKPSISSAFLGAILCPLCYLLYFVIMTIFGYSYTEDADFQFWLMLIGLAIYGGYLGYKNFETDN